MERTTNRSNLENQALGPIGVFQVFVGLFRSRDVVRVRHVLQFQEPATTTVRIYARGAKDRAPVSASKHGFIAAIGVHHDRWSPGPARGIAVVINASPGDAASVVPLSRFLHPFPSPLCMQISDLDQLCWHQLRLLLLLYRVYSFSYSQFHFRCKCRPQTAFSESGRKTPTFNLSASEQRAPLLPLTTPSEHHITRF